ncbi:MAG TPA: diaminopimelate epimerase [Tepidisphaeraceae bacterium]|nr:diaminopimelate epimerase [Tepidisphaeraceae bacterium]
MKFTKMHGIGNDYVYVNGFSETVADPGDVARKVSDRHFGIGSDGLILILPPADPSRADVRMRMFNTDGSEGEMCGNGVRCVAKYAWDHGLTRSNPMRVETGRGVLTLELKTDARDKVEQVTVNMGEPILEPAQVPFDPAKASPTKHPRVFRYELAGEVMDLVAVSMGNPHSVTFVDDVDALDLNRIGPLAERHPAFPKRVNAHWAQVVRPREIKMRTWERGSGITWACGTGASAVLVAGVLTGRSDRKALVHLPGGDLTIEWREADNNVYMTGPATEVFSGEWNG